jgi:hypothetical protein
MAAEFLREPLEVIEIIQPLCSRTFGVAPCNATGSECWNTDATCVFRSALDLSQTLPLYFVRDEAHEWIDDSSAFQPALALPALVSVSVAPTVLNVAGGSRNKDPLGYRAVMNVRIKDFPWNDVGTDPYVANRPYDPIERGSFWSKWLKRNPFHLSYVINHYSGQRGDTLAQMAKRQYVIERIDAGRDGVTIRAKDPLSGVNDLVAPSLSQGVLVGDITEAATAIAFENAVAADYGGAPGFARIGSEIFSYDDILEFGGITSFTGVTRGALGTTASSHSLGERIQRVLAYEDEPFQNIIYDLLTEWAEIDPSFIDKTAWDNEKNLFRGAFNLTAYISQPTSIPRLLGELSQQSLANIWWDERKQEIFLKAVKPDFSPETITDNDDIKAGSLAIKEHPDERISQVFVYYNLRNQAESPANRDNYENAAIFVDVGRQIQYGGKPVVREIFARFAPSEAIANNIGLTYLDRFKDVRREITFELSDETTFWTGDPVNIQHFLDTDFTGAPQANNWLITSAQEVESGVTYRFTAEDNGTGAVGVLWLWADESTDSPDWSSASEQERDTIGYWLNDDGTDEGGTPRPFRWL